MTGSTIIPASERFTLSTSATCASIERFRWTIPIPPSRAIAMARRASVTVSIAAETIGIARSIEGVRRVARRDVVRQDVRLGRDEEHVVEGEPLAAELPVELQQPLDVIRAQLGCYVLRQEAQGNKES